MITAETRTWRVTTAVRVFALAAGTGRALSSGELERALIPLAGLAMVAAVMAVLDLDPGASGMRWPCLAEAVLAGAWLAVPTAASEHLLVYLVAPCIIGGVRHGWLTATNASLAAGLALTLVASSVDQPDPSTRLSAGLFWVALGLGGGLLASRQTRSLRDLESRQAPYVAAHQLVAQLHDLTRAGAVGLDSAQLASLLQSRARTATGARSSAVFSRRDGGELRQLGAHGDTVGMASTALACHGERAVLDDALLGVALHAQGRAVGVLVLARDAPWTPEATQAVRDLAEELCLRLDTAVLFEDVRLMAAAEERNRIAREMHDGVAQEVVALGYVVDEIASVSTEPAVRSLATALRGEVSRVVAELRFSIFDLRHELVDQRLPAALAEYVREVGRDTDLNVHLLLDESGPPLAPRTETEVLRIAQEAITNVRKHARAQNLWVSLLSDGSLLRLVVEDDGVGDARPRDRHWGLQSMRERAEAIGARLQVTARQAGGTRVALQSHTHQPLLEEEASHGDHSPAR